MRVALALSFAGAGAAAFIVGWVAGNSNSTTAGTVRSTAQHAETAAKPQQYVRLTRFVTPFV
jgi:hypothetical protein